MDRMQTHGQNRRSRPSRHDDVGNDGSLLDDPDIRQLIADGSFSREAAIERKALEQRGVNPRAVNPHGATKTGSLDKQAELQDSDFDMAEEQLLSVIAMHRSHTDNHKDSTVYPVRREGPSHDNTPAPPTTSSSQSHIQYDDMGRQLKTPVIVSTNASLPGAYPGSPVAVDGEEIQSTERVDSSRQLEADASDHKGDPALEGRALTMSTSSSIGKKVIIAASMLFSLVIILAIVIPIVILATGQDQGYAGVQGDEVAVVADTGLHPIVPNLTNKTLAELQEPLSPAALAYEWVAEDTNREIKQDWRTMQRFVIAYINFAYVSKATVATSPSYTQHECQWSLRLFLVQCHEDGHFQSVSLVSDRHFLIPKVSFPQEMFLLPLLEKVEIFRILLKDPLETLLPLNGMASSPWKQLKHLKISDCELGGSLPTELGLMTSLTLLDLSTNKLQSTIPSELGLLTNLETLLLQDNKFSGKMPKDVLELSSLTLINVEGNNMLEG